MKTPGGILAICLAFASSAFSQDRPDAAPAERRALSTDSDYEAVRLSRVVSAVRTSDLYIVYNDTRDEGGAQLRERAFIVKLTNLFTF